MQAAKDFDPSHIAGLIAPDGPIKGPFTAYVVADSGDLWKWLDSDTFLLHQLHTWGHDGSTLVRLRRKEGAQITVQATDMPEHSISGPEDKPFDVFSLPGDFYNVFGRELTDDEEKQVLAWYKQEYDVTL
jgi:hypothetical protein